MAAATSSTRATKINAPTFTSGRKYSIGLSPPSQPSGATDGPERSAVSAWKSGSRYGPISGVALPSGRERLQPQNIVLVILLRHAQRDRTIRSTSDELLHQRIRRPLDLL